MKPPKTYHLFLIYDIIVITASFLLFIWLKPATKTAYLPQYYKPFLGFAFLWMVISLIGNKFNLITKKKLSDLVIPIIRIDFTILAIISILIFIFHTFHYSRLIVLGTILLTTFLEIFFVGICYFHRKLRKVTDLSTSSLTTKPTYMESNSLDYRQEEFNLTLPEIEDIENSIYPNLKERYLASYSKVFEFIHNNLPLKNIPQNESLVLSTHTLYNIENIEPQSQQLFLNLHKINDLRRINRFLIQVNENLKYGGYFISFASTIEERYNHIINKYPPIINQIFYGIDFIFKRVFPKIPVFKECYFALTKGENRAISESEVLGRLCFCGFRIIATEKIDNSLYFIVQKTNKPREDSSPSYGPFTKLRRVGKGGEIIYVYKFRTMHPYSEYLQDYIHEKYQLEDCGKFKNDFRITGWGKILRKLFIDELPQFINFFSGELGLVGVRALSEQYFKLYPKDLQELRVRYKPGLVPPYYYDMPNSFDEIIESERRYLSLKQTHPYSTDFKYFFKAWYNIIFKGARSK